MKFSELLKKDKTLIEFFEKWFQMISEETLNFTIPRHANLLWWWLQGAEGGPGPDDTLATDDVAAWASGWSWRDGREYAELCARNIEASRRGSP